MNRRPSETTCSSAIWRMRVFVFTLGIYWSFSTAPRNGSEVGVASASDFVKSKRFDAQLDLQALIDDINIQISHLQYGRPSTVEQKLNGARMEHVRGAINSALRRFEADNDGRGQSYLGRASSGFADHDNEPNGHGLHGDIIHCFGWINLCCWLRPGCRHHG